MSSQPFARLLRRRRFIGTGVAAAWAAGPLSTSSATSTVRLIAGAAPGGGVDLLLRRLADIAAARSDGPRWIVDNRPGGSGLIAARALLRAAPDGRSFGLLGRNLLTLQAMGASIDLLRGVEPVARVANAPCFIAVAAGSSHGSLAELLASARQAAQPLVYGHGGQGSPGHLCVELLAAHVGGPLSTHAVPFRTVHDALPALLRGELAFVAGVLPSALALSRSGRLRVLAVTTRTRAALLPAVPTVAESGFAGYAYESWSGVFAPRRTPAQAIASMAQALRDALADPAFVAFAQGTGIEPDPIASPQAFAAEVARCLDDERWLVRRLGLKYVP